MGLVYVRRLPGPRLAYPGDDVVDWVSETFLDPASRIAAASYPLRLTVMGAS